MISLPANTIPQVMPAITEIRCYRVFGQPARVGNPWFRQRSANIAGATGGGAGRGGAVGNGGESGGTALTIDPTAPPPRKQAKAAPHPIGCAIAISGASASSAKITATTTLPLVKAIQENSPA
ncbi:hypothetical protein ACWDPT_34425, partial [Nocardia sp. NPDC003644]